MKDFIKKNYYLLFFLIVLLGLTFLAFKASQESTELRRENSFRFRTARAQFDIEYRIDNYIQLLKVSKGLMIIKDTVTRSDWKKYVDILEIKENYPGIQGIGYAIKIDRSKVDEFEQSVRAEGFPEFRITPSGERDIYTSILYLEPFRDRNLRAFGYDMFTDPIRQKAMTHAIRYNEASISGRVELVQETEEDRQWGFLIYLPVYTSQADPPTEQERIRNIKGFVYYPFRMDDLIAATLGDSYEDIDIKIYDGQKIAPQYLMYHKNKNIDDVHVPDPDPVVTRLKIGHHSWTLVFYPENSFGSSADINQPLLVLVSGVIISVLIFFTLTFFAYARQQAISELDRTRELDKRKDEFLGIASHELRTPLTSSKAYLGLLIRNISDPMESKLASKAMVSLNKLQLLIEELFDLTKIESGKLSLSISRFDICEVLEIARENVLHTISTHEIRINEEAGPIYIEGDKVRLEQAVVNLLTNAIKYSPKAKAVEVNIIEKDETVMIKVKDKGIGISEELQEKIFEKFYRVNDIDQTYPGMGIGLHITMEVVQRHNGKIWVESEPGKGSTFYLELPQTANKN